MASDLKFIGWESKGLRCPDHEIDLTDNGNPLSISLIQMPNGTGKTTSLKLLRAVMSGDAENWDPEVVRSYQKQKAPRTQPGVFTVRFEVDGQRVTIKLTLNFDEGKARYETTVKSGKREGFSPPRSLRRFMTPGFVRFFIFDGELAENLLDPTETDAERAIEDLFQIQLLDTMKSRVEEYWSRKTSDKRVSKDNVLEKHIDKYQRSKKRLEKVLNLKKRDQKKLQKKNRELTLKKSEFEDELKKRSSDREKLATASRHLEKWHNKVESRSLSVLDQMRSPQALSETFAVEIVRLKKNLDRVQLPERTAREFFEELAEEAECICGRELNDQHRQTIRKRADQYLGSDDVAFLNAMKADISDAEENIEEVQGELAASIGDLIEAIEKEQSWQNELDDVRAEVTSSDPRAAKISDEVDELQDEISKIEDRMERYESLSEQKGIDDTWGIEILRRRVNRHDKKVGEVAKALGLLRKRDALEAILNTAREIAREKISQEVCRDANEKIDTLMPNNDIHIDAIDSSLRLRNQESGSAGETLTVGYAFLSTLFNRSSYRIPFVVDSPANPIDLDIRQQIGSIVPLLSHQFIAFTISSEREGFVTSLRQSATKKIKYLTLFRKGIEEAERKVAQQPAHRKREFTDGWCVEGPSYFNSFQVDEDPND